MDLFFAAVLGLLMGSFAGVLIARLPRGEDVVFTPSHCDCGHRLRPVELIPLVSWLWQRGRCRACGRFFGFEPLVLELLSSFLAIFFARYFSFHLALMLILISPVLLAAVVIDWRTMTLPDQLTLPGLGAVLLLTMWGAMRPLEVFWPTLLAAFTAAGLLVATDLLATFVMRRGRERFVPAWPLGYPQISLALFLGLWLPLPAVLLLVSLTFFPSLRVPERFSLIAFVFSLFFRLDHWLLAVQAAGFLSLLAGLYWFWRETRLFSSPSSPSGEVDPVAIGFGDVKLAALLGALVGMPALFAGLVFSVLFGGVFGLFWKLAGRPSQLPFGPFLVLGFLMSLLIFSSSYSSQLLSWFFTFFFLFSS